MSKNKAKSQQATAVLPLEPAAFAPQRVLLGVAFIVFATLLVYLPAIRGDFIWDDPEHVVNNPTLRDLGGLVEMWTRPTSLPQWYPMVHTSFWVEYHLWGPQPLGYHLVNVLFHIIASLLLWRVLVMLQVPGAWLAAAIFALHPVQVESVAWITERKNVLSAVFYLLALIWYLRFAIGTQRWGDYAISLAFFLAALLSKSVTATLPAAVLVILWWKRGSLRWRDVGLLVPFFIVGISMGLLTAHLEVSKVGATAQHITELDLSWTQRVLIAGRAVWFYVSKLLVPWPLVFIYPRWKVDATAWWQWVYPVGVLVIVVMLALARKRFGGGPLAGVLLFVGTLFPALGFVNVYPMRFSFVADHFQYLASAALIALGASILCRKVGAYGRVVLVPLIVLTVIRAQAYTDAETLWRDTLARNPESWMVHENLADALLARAQQTGDPATMLEAREHYVRAMELAPNLYETNFGAGLVLGAGDASDQQLAMQYLRRTVQLNPDFARAYFYIGQLHQRRGEWEPAAESYRQMLSRQPNDVDANLRLAECLMKLRQFDQAITYLQKAIELQPRNAAAWFNLGMSQNQLGNKDEALKSLQRAIQLDPSLLQQNVPH
ncbi:MAG TPA: tetratricopeptide repeat protein [Tepidisphaeraceae bacterium]